MRTRSALAASIAIALLFTPSFLRAPASQCSAVSEVESLADDIYRLAYNNLIPEMTQDQFKRMENIYVTYQNTKQSFEKQRDELQESFYALARTPFPTKKSLVAKQEEINRKEDAIDDIAILTAYEIRQVLTAKQLQAIYLVDLDKEFRRAKLSAEQQNRMIEIAVAEQPAKVELTRQLTHLQYELAGLLNQPKIDEKAIFAKQHQINELQGNIADHELNLKLKLRTVMDWQQKNRLYNDHRSDTFSAIGVSKETDDRIMDLHMQRAAISESTHQKMMDLSGELKAKFQQQETKGNTVIDLQKQIDKLADQARCGETGIIADIRMILTPQERDKMVELLKQEAKGIFPPFPPESEYHEHQMDHMDHDQMSHAHMEQMNH